MKYLEQLFASPWNELLAKKEAVVSALSTDGGKALLKYFDDLHTSLLKVLVYSPQNETVALRDQFLKGKLVMLEEIVEIPNRFEELIRKEAAGQKK